MNWGAIDPGILGPALAAGLLVLATHVPLGMQVLDRGIVFIDLAIAQIAGLGVIAADALGLPEHGLAVQGAALCAALLGAALLTWTERRAPAQQEALIGVLFVLAASAGLLLLASNPRGGEHLKDLLVGQILWVGPRQLATLAAVTAVLISAMALGVTRRLGRFGFYATFALAVTAQRIATAVAARARRPRGDAHSLLFGVPVELPRRPVLARGYTGRGPPLLG